MHVAFVCVSHKIMIRAMCRVTTMKHSYRVKERAYLAPLRTSKRAVRRQRWESHVLEAHEEQREHLKRLTVLAPS